MEGILQSLGAWAPIIGLGFGAVWFLIALFRGQLGLGVIALIVCAIAGQLHWIFTILMVLLFGWMILLQPKFVRAMASNFAVSGELVGFLWERKMWWMVPMVVMLLGFGLLMIFASASGVAPFVYALF